MTDTKGSCKHQYIVGYSFRMPQPFFHSLPCDNCGCKIKLSFPWKILSVVTYLLGWILAFRASTSVHISVFGNTFLISLALFILLSYVFGQLNRLILRYGKWIEVKA